jgi:hypothetical protein
MTFDPVIIGNVRPPLIVLKPFPLVIPIEVIPSFLDAVAALDRLRSQRKRPTERRRSGVQRRDARRVEIEAVLAKLTAEYRAPTRCP